MTEPTLLERIFAMPEKDVQVFADSFKQPEESPEVLAGQPTSGIEELLSGKPLEFQKPQEPIVQVSGFLRIDHNWHYSDYAWHIAPAKERRPWGVSIERVIYAIGAIIHDLVPRTIHVNIFPPSADWGIQEVTVKALDVRNCWNMPQEDIDKVTLKFFEVLNTLL